MIIRSHTVHFNFQGERAIIPSSNIRKSLLLAGYRKFSHEACITQHEKRFHLSSPCAGPPSEFDAPGVSAPLPLHDHIRARRARQQFHCSVCTRTRRTTDLDPANRSHLRMPPHKVSQSLAKKFLPDAQRRPKMGAVICKWICPFWGGGG